MEQFVRQDDGSWKYTAAEGRDANLFLPSLGCLLPLAEVYDRVTLEDEVQPPTGMAEESAGKP